MTRHECPVCGGSRARQAKFCSNCWTGTVDQKKGRWTTARRRKQSEKLKAHWSAGTYANRAKAKTRPDLWLSAHDAMIRELAGTILIQELAQRLTDRFSVKRSPAAVRRRCYQLGVDYVLPGYTGHDVGRLMGVDQHMALRWLNDGLIPHQRSSTTYRALFLATREDLLDFIRKHPEAYDRHKIKDQGLRAEAETVHRTDPLMSVREVAAYLDRHPSMIRQWLREGQLPGRMSPYRTKGRGGTNYWLVRRSDLVRRLDWLASRPRRGRVA